ARPHDDSVAVFEETARLAGWEFDRPSSAGRDLEQAAESAFLWRGDRAGAEQIAGAQIAAATAVMRHQLGHGPVEVARVAHGQSLRGKSFRPQPGLELDVEGRPRPGPPRRKDKAGAPDRPPAAAPAPSETAPTPREGRPTARWW